MASTGCTLKRCKGKRGCICPKGNIPIGSYAGKKLDPLPLPVSVEPLHVALVISPARKKKTIAPKANSPFPKLIPISPKREKKETQVLMPKTETMGTDSAAASEAVEQELSGEDYSALNGEVVIRYNHYKKRFHVDKGSTTSAAIDAEYALSFAYPNSKLHLSTYGPSDFSFEDEGLTSRPRVKEKPIGTYLGLDPSIEYWVDIEEDEVEKKMYEERQDKLIAENEIKRKAKEEAAANGMDIIVQSKTESCSCVEGNPCLDKYACKNWDRRYEIAKTNGWKGFQ